jgi:DNA-binding phage protein
MAKELRENPEFAVEYLRAALEEGDDPRILLIACDASLNQEAGSPKLRKRLALSGRAFTARCRPKGIHGSRR